ncbi:MAG: hypothetical protein D6740_13090, partial [Alphaproteobacteria bacterium]
MTTDSTTGSRTRMVARLGRRLSAIALVAVLAAGLAACERKPAEPTVEEAKAFLDRAESRLEAMEEEASRIAWVNATFITYDTDWLNAKMTERYTKLLVDLAHEAA